MICEFLSGPDTLLSSYYTYLDSSGGHLFELTKRMIRRNPKNIGMGCYHITDDLPETAALGRKFFRGIGYRGLGNIEFKRDTRDGQLKVIEVNARFTAAHELLVKAGMDIDWLIYCHITGLPVSRDQQLRTGMRLLYPSEDFDAFRDLRSRGELSFPQWLRSLAHRQVFPYFSLSDPVPALSKGWSNFRMRILRNH
jgi:predicted ATP-grasp superfamily ATP-dependent carboligase